jgi:hypothetical protein
VIKVPAVTTERRTVVLTPSVTVSGCSIYMGGRLGRGSVDLSRRVDSRIEEEIMRFILALAGLPLTFLLLSQAALASSLNCPKEPAAGTPIVSGDVYSGSNCELYTPGDVDSFAFNANAGDTWQIIVAYQGGVPGTCMALSDPNGKVIYPSTNCTYNGELVDSQTLTVTGQYTIHLTMQGDSSDGTYALSLERINPFPPDAQPIALAHAIDGTTSPATAQPTYTFYGVTTGTYQVSVSYTGGVAGTCLNLYYPGSAKPQPSPDQGCTYNGTYQFTFTPPKNGTYMVLLDSQGDATGDYSFEVSCYSGKCTQAVPPPCTLKDTLTYDSTTDTLTMNFSVGNTEKVPVKWNAWLTYQNTIKHLFSVSQPVTNPPASITQKISLSPEGTIGVLSTLTTASKGIVCSSFPEANTGTP